MVMFHAARRKVEDDRIREILERNEPMKEFYISPLSSDREEYATFTTDDNDTVKIHRKTLQVIIKN